MINKFYDLATMQPKVPATVQSHYELLEHKASECIGCHACEARCPFGVPIAERMEKNSEIIWVLKTGKDMKIYEIQERDPQILAELLKVWEASVQGDPSFPFGGRGK